MTQNRKAVLGKHPWAPWEAGTCPRNPGSGAEAGRPPPKPCFRTKPRAGGRLLWKLFHPLKRRRRFPAGERGHANHENPLQELRPPGVVFSMAPDQLHHPGLTLNLTVMNGASCKTGRSSPFCSLRCNMS